MKEYILEQIAERHRLSPETSTKTSTKTSETSTNKVDTSTDLISRQAAIEAMAPFDTNHELRDTLESLPSVEPKPVMTEEVREAIMRLTMCAREECSMCKYEDSCGFDKQVEMATENMNTILKAFTERPKGEWVFNPKDAIDLMFTRPKCNKCGFESGDGGNFCSNCGADMRGDKE